VPALSETIEQIDGIALELTERPNVIGQVQHRFLITGRQTFAREHRPHPSGLATVETVSFGLLVLLLALTFSGAAGPLDARRAQIVDEANAVSTA
jgi:hypothetical protein